jgi:hypothetical protein
MVNFRIKYCYLIKNLRTLQKIINEKIIGNMTSVYYMYLNMYNVYISFSYFLFYFYQLLIRTLYKTDCLKKVILTLQISSNFNYLLIKLN